ncbi:MAG TPA: hypothetical protein PKA44_08795 [Saprospiraceae bacterium]|jgi:hypothetical protein|nr:hypothetical protein [Saprospiraceae bacterium]HQK69416.1 hypothetical protein [Bacteroidales bacterium]
MRKIIDYDEMVATQGGKFIDGFCLAVGVGRLFAPVLAITGVGLVVLNVATAGCLIYEAVTLK